VELKRFTKGKIFMSQEIVKVVLSQQGESDVLTFDIKENEKVQDYFVDLSDSANSQTQLKRIFARLLTLLIEKDIVLKLEVENGFTRTLQREVSREYIQELNDELKKVKELIKEQLADDEQEY
jgi:hypothetical protein